MIRIDELPSEYIDAMKNQLGDEYDLYLQTLSEKPVSGVRVNTLKANPESVFRDIGVVYDRIDWTDSGSYVDDTYVFTKHPYYYAGLYYVQEPSAMTPAAWLGAKPGEKILDLCAAPGGKSTQIACDIGRGDAFGGSGLLMSNDPSASRCKALLKNIELSGIPNVIVTSAMPDELAACYPEYFDRILVDAPCSGEGMFRKDRAVLNAYREHGPEYFSRIQKEVLTSAAAMLRPGGTLVYSTCTFSDLEDEKNIEWFIGSHPEFVIDRMTKLYPHRIKGEGHFVCRLIKNGPSESADHIFSVSASCADGYLCKGAGDKKIPGDFITFLSGFSISFDLSRLYLKDEYIYLLPAGAKLFKGIHYIRTGLLMGRVRNNRFEPSQALAMALKSSEWKCPMILDKDDDRVLRYLKCETIEADDEYNGYRLVCLGEHPLGWVKQSGYKCKNKYYPGWRYN